MAAIESDVSAIIQSNAQESEHISTAKKLGLWNMWVAFTAFIIALPMGLYQVAERSDLFPALESAQVYYASISTHGVLMAYVFSTFFIMGFGYHTAGYSLQQKLWSTKFAWSGFIIALFGVVLAAIPLLTGNASVMYTFYPPEVGHPIFYIGATLLIVGSWFWSVDMIVAMTQWKKANPGKVVPLVMFGVTINALLWLWTSAGVAAEVVFQIIPVTLGLTETFDPGLARTLFSWTLHAIVYFWLFPAYIVMYSIMPKEAGGKLFSDEMGRVAFVMLFIFSVPIGFHHLYMDPQQAAGWKLLHMFGTFMVAVPTLITGFTILATLEISGRLRGGKGLLGWVSRIKWDNPVVLGTALAMLMLTVGGWGGVINASYSMNSLIHNTQWVPGHFHLIYGGTTVIMYFAVAYWLWPKIIGRALYSNKMALIQLWSWFFGMWITTAPWHILGLLGQPRRVNTLPYDTAIAALWDPYEMVMLAGSLLLTVSGFLFIINLVMTHLNTRKQDDMSVTYAVAVHQPMHVPKLLNSLSFWNWAMLCYMIISYGYPIIQFAFIGTPQSTPWSY